MVLVISEVV